MAAGIALTKLALETNSNTTRQTLQEEALSQLLFARRIDPDDAVIAYNLALIYADIRDILRGIKHVRKSLYLDKTSSNAWNLLCLLLSAQKKFKLALSVCTHALAEDASNISLILTKAKLEQVLEEPLQALQTYKSAFSHFSTKLQHDTNNKENPPIATGGESVRSFDGGGRGAPASASQARRGTNTNAMSQNSLEDTVSVTPSQARTLSHSLHTHSLEHPDEVPPQVNPVLTRLWLSAAEAFAQGGLLIDAVECLQEAKASGGSTSAEVFYQEGCMMEMQDQYLDALSQYQKALAVDCSHTMSAIRMATVLHERLQDIPRAEHILTSVLRSDPTCHQAWFQLGVVLKGKEGQEAYAAECLQRAIQLDKTAPILPFSSIPRELS